MYIIGHTLVVVGAGVMPAIDCMSVDLLLLVMCGVDAPAGLVFVSLGVVDLSLAGPVFVGVEFVGLADGDLFAESLILPHC